MPAEASSELTRKVLRILAALAQRGESGIRLVDAARATQIPRPTVFRILKELADSGFVTKAESGTYALGHAVFELALSAPAPIVDITTLRALARSLADRCGDTVYVAVRQFDGVNYVVRAEGDYPLQTRIPVGTNRGLANSYTGVALLPFVEAEQRARAIAARLDGLDADAADAVRATIADLMSQIATRGYCSAPDLVLPGVAGLSTPIRAGRGAPYAAIAISGVSPRLPAERIEPLARLLLATEKQMRACFA
ncbi:helix-turn-helix domain-containing protein [Microbacterium betulae]|uniref:Helix-turn-helix domain-containing protein n=1 Tax=Microbacterium betulae TaxID=2981139 RepID=A0AA97FH74_9MICO|nr:helix-turn-helix domain-containing protein [Microbacterium sp. AB]WOF22843.1 helix-turn-helix domain-containing protein [Microbacterium sp. AB]